MAPKGLSQCCTGSAAKYWPQCRNRQRPAIDTGARNDQVPFKLGHSTKHRHDQPPMRRGRQPISMPRRQTLFVKAVHVARTMA
jgi:hypothetical protein